MSENLISAGAAFEQATQALAHRTSPLESGVANGKAREAAKSFEAFFISQMLSEMFAGIKTDPVFGGGPGETMFRSLMIDEYGKSLAENGGVGIADSVLREIVRLQEVDNNDR